MAHDLSLAESGALVLDAAAAALDGATDIGMFLAALERNHRVWRAIAVIAARHDWPVPDRRQSQFAVSASARAGVNDDDIHALVALGRRISGVLAGGDIEGVRRRACHLWPNRGRPDGADIDRWLAAEMDDAGGMAAE